MKDWLARMDSRKKQAKKRRLFHQQDGRCYYCGCQMKCGKGPSNGIVPKTFATFEHLDDRYSDDRGKRSGQRVVLACHGCNHKRGQERTASMSEEELHERSGRSKFLWADVAGEEMAFPRDNRVYSVRVWMDSEHGYYEALEWHLLGMSSWLDDRDDMPYWAKYESVTDYLFGDDVSYEGMYELSLRFSKLCEDLGLAFEMNPSGEGNDAK